jgi:hypothetical protein
VPPLEAAFLALTGAGPEDSPQNRPEDTA